ncbi:MAG TPA: COX15/CtaA family protein [Propioniciclava sp.]|jgi:cytochrome c oxidase assembly protein subunit 15|uniref:COX15/CtaA family protein n=1 Tax=Propioniciclava sp. TaxID=2038686 RepID=UPI002C7FE95D|nr:COX15/CtaA family protein [Propioniciclava sp.]HRL48623.1 COX15/CtaA family protein [Propioniciclava sp.]HRL80539.1 COX15/CtaA family protein [Propioniciclava sp.]
MDQLTSTTPLRSPSTVSLRRWAVASLVANMVIVWTGALVRLTKSGLGCATWPQCQPGSYVPLPEDGMHGLIEFGNRLLTFALAAIALGMFLAARRAYRAGTAPRQLPTLAFCVGLGIIAQAVIGGVSVLVQLNPWVVGLHMVASVALIGICVQLVHLAFDLSPVRVPPRLHLLTTVVFALGVLIIALGVVVTGAGPHAGDGAAQRNGLSPDLTAKLHAWAVWAIVAAVALGLFWAWAEPRARRLWLGLLAVILLQGLIGYVQYFTHLPMWMVFAHMVGTTLFAAALSHLFLLTRPGVPGAAVRPQN